MDELFLAKLPSIADVGSGLSYVVLCITNVGYSNPSTEMNFGVVFLLGKEGCSRLPLAAGCLADSAVLKEISRAQD